MPREAFFAGQSFMKGRKQEMKRFCALALVTLCLAGIYSAHAELEQSPFLDHALSALEKDNIFILRYNALTGSEVEALFEMGIPYLFGGTYKNGVFGQWPKYSKRVAFQTSQFFVEGELYVNGFDCVGFTRWVYSKCHLPEHDSLSNLALNWGDHANEYVYSQRAGQEMPPWREVSPSLQVGDLFVTRHEGGTYRHVMMYIGTLRDFGSTSDEVPDLADYLDYPLVIHCGTHPQYGERFQQFIDSNPEEYGHCHTTDGGVQVSILGVPLEECPCHAHVQNTDFSWFTLPDGSIMTALEVFDLSSYCWYRMER